MQVENPKIGAENSTDMENLFSKLNVPYTLLEIMVAISAVIGNALVIIAFKNERKLRRRTNYYIISLAVADLLVGLVGIPCAVLASIGLPKELYACLFTMSLLVVFCTVSIFSLVAVSADRYWAILYPMSYSVHINTNVTLGIISVCWLTGIFVGFLPLFGWNSGFTTPPECIFTKVMDYDYLVFLYFGTIIFPAVLLAVFYTHIYSVVLKQIRQIVSMNKYCTGTHKRGTINLRRLGEARRKEVQVTKNLSIIVLFFVICWMPLYTINCIRAFCPKCGIPAILTDLCIILTHLNSVGNPLLYAYHLSDFRSALQSLFVKSTESNSMEMAQTAASVEVKRDKLSENNTKLNFNKRVSKLFVFGGAKSDTNSVSVLKCVHYDTNESNLNADLLTNSDPSGNNLISRKDGDVAIKSVSKDANNVVVQQPQETEYYDNISTNNYTYTAIEEINCYDNTLYTPDDATVKRIKPDRQDVSDDGSYITMADHV